MVPPRDGVGLVVRERAQDVQSRGDTGLIPELPPQGDRFAQQRGGAVTMANTGNALPVVNGTTIFTFDNLFVNGGSIDFNGNNQLVGTLATSSPLPGQGGLITNTGPAVNFTRVNGNTVQIRRLLPGDRVGVGRSLLLFGSGEQIAARMATMSAPLHPTSGPPGVHSATTAPTVAVPIRSCSRTSSTRAAPTVASRAARNARETAERTSGALMNNVRATSRSSRRSCASQTDPIPPPPSLDRRR